jgi:hypothetical protein
MLYPFELRALNTYPENILTRTEGRALCAALFWFDRFPAGPGVLQIHTRQESLCEAKGAFRFLMFGWRCGA